jgi:hypothetical protein
MMTNIHKSKLIKTCVSIKKSTKKTKHTLYSPSQQSLLLQSDHTSSHVNNQGISSNILSDDLHHNQNSTQQISTSNNQSCTFCDFSTIKRPTKNHIQLKKDSSHENKHICTYLSCSKCQHLTCSKCLHSIVKKMKENQDTKDVWFKQVSNYLHHDILPKNFVGHCCEIKEKISDKCIHHHIDADHMQVKDMKYDGYLHFPQVHIILDSPIVDYVDVHGLGKEDSCDGTPGLIHGVVDKLCAIECAQNNIKPSGLLSKVRVSHQSSIEFTDVFNKKSKLRYLLEVFEIDDSVDTKTIKHQRPTTNDIKNSLCLKNDMKAIDVWIILGMTKSVDTGCHLINMRWHSELDKNKWNKSLNVMDLYSTLLSKCKHKGIEAQRSGGSNGLTTFSNTDILRLIASNGAFPRKGKGVKIIKEKTQWKCYYLGVSKKKNNIVSWNYQQPQRGGNFKMNKQLQQKYKDVTCAMTIAKYNSALLSVEFSKILQMEIQAKAVKSAINDIDEVRLLINYSKLDNLETKRRTKMKKEMDDNFINRLCLRNKYTLVAYPCGYHYDIFDKKAHSLENKICFSYDIKLNKKQYDFGRGGDGKGKFVFAILDWTSH